MPKVIVTANEDFYDKANNIARKQGATFVVKDSYARELGKSVKIGRTFGVKEDETKKQAPAKKSAEAPAKKAAAKKGVKEKNDKAGPTGLTRAGIEKVKK